MSGKERVGNLAILLIVTHTQQGFDILKPCLKAKKIKVREFSRCIKLMLSFYHWVHLDIKKSDMANAKVLVCEMLDLLKKCFPQNDGNG